MRTSFPSTRLVQNYESHEPAYFQAFQTFLAHTDQKQKARTWLEHTISSLQNRGVFIDAGAGNGALTQSLSAQFEQTIGIEPNPALFNQLQSKCSRSVRQTILESAGEAIGDFVLCSHVFYYIPKEEWAANLQRLLSWVADDGCLVICLQNPLTDSMQMVQHLIGGSFDLSELVPMLNDMEGGPYSAGLDRVQAHIHTEQLQTACEVAEFVLNVLDVPEDLMWFELEQYVEERFANLNGGYSFSCHQDFLTIRRTRS